MLCKNNMANLDYKSKKNNTKHIFPSFLFFLFGITKTTYTKMNKCYAMQILKKKIEKTKNKKQNKTKTAKKNGYKE